MPAAMPPKRTRAEEKTPKTERAPRVPHWQREGARLAAILTERGIGQTEFAERLGRKFHNVHRWTRGYEFTPQNQAVAARELGLPPDAFQGVTQKRERHTRAVLAQFTARCPIAASLTEEEWHVLRSIRFHDATLRPSIAFFEAVSYALKGAIRIDEIQTVAEENAALDESLAHKPPLRRKP
jgi:transcriptional regulator with XRE-family HTH domain